MQLGLATRHRLDQRRSLVDTAITFIYLALALQRTLGTGVGDELRVSRCLPSKIARCFLA